MLKSFKTIWVLGILFFLVPGIFSTKLPHVHAAVPDWQKGVSIYPRYDADFASETFQASLRNARAAHANTATLIIPLYQSSIFSTDVHHGWNTPTDASLRSGIDYAHSLGMRVMLKIHLESNGGEWRAHISPSDRDTWFRNYGDLVVHFATIGRDQGAEMMTIGSELIKMSTRDTPSNTGNWFGLISRIRGVYGGALTYSANWGGGSFEDEKNRIDFWGGLDFVGIAAYFPVGSSFSPSVDELRGSWDGWNRGDIGPLAGRTGKPIVFTEVGYKSVDGAHYEPWNFSRGGGANEQEQANDYEALFSYWNDHGYMQGVHLWDWESDPNAGGSGTTSYTPQRKVAEGVMRDWFGRTGEGSGESPSPHGGTVSFTGSASVNSGSVGVGTPVDITARFVNNDGPIGDILLDVEIYSGGVKVHQHFISGQSFADHETKTVATQWTPSAPGSYTVALGVFTSSWSRGYTWNGSAAVIEVIGTGGGGSIPGGIDIWWPTDGVIVGGVQPFKAMLRGLSVSDYDMFWQVDGDRLNIMPDNFEDYPHKEVVVDLSGWTWRGDGPYTLTFIAKDRAGRILGERSVSIRIIH